MTDWVLQARRTLRDQRRDAGWGYRPGGSPAVEPTVLACLALLAADLPDGTAADGSPSESSETTADVVRRSADWLLQLQAPSGAVSLSTELAQVHWGTSFAIWLWSSLHVDAERRRRAVDWLLSQEGFTFVQDPNGPLGHDTTIPGWAWVAGTHSWMEPTCIAILGLRREKLADHHRVQDGLRLIRDRVIATGGWNCGNNKVFGTVLRPRPATTGWALLALANLEPMAPYIERSLDYLEHELPMVRSPQSLGMGLLGLSAWGRRPVQANAWLEESFHKLMARGTDPAQLAYLLIASADRQPGCIYVGKGEPG